MTDPPAGGSRSASHGLSGALAVYLRPPVLVVMLLGFSAGLPLALSGSTLQVWMRQSGVDLRTIGLFTLVGTPYTLKFLWAPLIDALDVPVLSRLLGRRRGWLVLSQAALMAALTALGTTDPVGAPWLVVAGALLVATASATQDIVIDAFRVESLAESEQAAGMASYVAAYRIGMLASGAGCLFLVDALRENGASLPAAWLWGYAAMAALVLVGVLATFAAKEPAQSEEVAHAHQGSRLKSVIATTIGAFSEFLTRPMALVVLSFVVLFKFCDALAGAMTNAFVIDLGFSLTEYAAIIKGVGLAATLIGGFAGGLLARAYPLAACLWIGAVLQATSNLAFSWQAYMGYSIPALTLTIIIENFTGAIGTVIFVAYLSALCINPLHTATQYALLTALAAVGRTYLSAPAGYLAEWSGWPMFFVICALAGIPSLVLLMWLQASGHFRILEKEKP